MHRGSSAVGSEVLYPRDLIEKSGPLVRTIVHGGNVFVRGTAADTFKRELSAGCNYERPEIRNVRVLDPRSPEGPVSGDVAVTIGGNGDLEVPDGVSVVEVDEEGSHVLCEIVERSVFGRIAVFFDRDDTINDDVGHCRRAEDISILPGVGDALKRLNDAGLMTIMVTNQSVIGRGWLDEKGLERIHERVRKDVLPGRIDDIFHCPHLPDDRCDCRKPRIGMARQVLGRYNIDTLRSFMIGDSDKDVQFGEAIGCRSFKVSEEYTFADAVEDILSELRG